MVMTKMMGMAKMIVMKKMTMVMTKMMVMKTTSMMIMMMPTPFPGVTIPPPTPGS